MAIRAFAFALVATLLIAVVKVESSSQGSEGGIDQISKENYTKLKSSRAYNV